MLNAKLKQNLKQGLSRPTQHYPIIPKEDLSKIQDYLKGENPILLRYRVWYLLAIHFVSHGIEFHQQLKLSSLLFCEDESGNKYITISHETCQKNHQGGIAQKGEESQDKRMYATGGPNCPVKAVEFFISKTDQSASALFNHCNSDAVKIPLHQVFGTMQLLLNLSNFQVLCQIFAKMLAFFDLQLIRYVQLQSRPSVMLGLKQEISCLCLIIRERSL